MFPLTITVHSFEQLDRVRAVLFDDATKSSNVTPIKLAADKASPTDVKTEAVKTEAVKTEATVAYSVQACKDLTIQLVRLGWKEETVAEVEYRYPGPKPRTKEAAILMLADAIESSARAMPEPNPSRIENLVRKLASKRLADGQFDDCDMTFRELALIQDAMISRLQAIYHSRISYPGVRVDDDEADRSGGTTIVTRVPPASRPVSA